MLNIKIVLSTYANESVNWYVQALITSQFVTQIGKSVRPAKKLTGAQQLLNITWYKTKKMGDNLQFSASQTGPKYLCERWVADVLGHIVWRSFAIESRLFFFNSFREYVYIFSPALPGFGQAAERECFTSRHAVPAPKTTSIQCSRVTARWWDALCSGFERRSQARNAERRVEEKKNEWVAEAAVTQRLLHQAARNAPSSSGSVFCHDGLRLILTHTRKPDLNHSYWHWEDATFSHEPVPLNFKHQSACRPDSLWQRGRSVTSHSQQAYNFHSVERRRVLCHYSRVFCSC